MIWMGIQEFMQKTNPLGRKTKQPEIVAVVLNDVVRIEVTRENRERLFYLLRDMGCKIVYRKKRF